MELQDFPYPFPVGRFDLDSQGQRVTMAYMDVRPARPNGRTVVLLHGKNFCGATWEGTVRPLQAAGDRVIVPDQVGFCRSKSLSQLASALVAQRHRIGRAAVGELLHRQRFSLQANRKTCKGDSHPDRNAQFVHIDDSVTAALARGEPVISVDTKKKELVRLQECRPGVAPSGRPAGCPGP